MRPRPRPRPRKNFEAEATIYEAEAEARHVRERLSVYVSWLTARQVRAAHAQSRVRRDARLRAVTCGAR